MNNVRKITILSILIALNIILGKLSFGPEFAKVNLGFIALIISGFLYGSRATLVVAGLANVLTFTLLGNGTFSFWFLIPALLAGATYGLLNKPTWIRIILVNVVVMVGISFILNTWLIAAIYHLDYSALLSVRIIKMIVSLLFQIILSFILLRNRVFQQFKDKLTMNVW